MIDTNVFFHIEFICKNNIFSIEMIGIAPVLNDLKGEFRRGNNFIGYKDPFQDFIRFFSILADHEQK